MAYIGKNTVRVDGRDKVSGRAKYVDDYDMENTLQAVVVRAERAHANVVKIDVSKAKEFAYVFGAEDLASNVIVDIINDQPVFADKKVRFFGEAVCVVAAKTKQEAQRAAKLVRIEYEDLPVYLTGREALEPDAEKIHDGGNLISTFENVKGDLKKGFDEADLVLEHTYFTPYQEHAYLEPDASFSYYENGILNVVTSSQNVFHDKRMIGNALGLKDDELRVTSATVGGAFGGKDGHMTQIFGALVTQKTGLPTKIVFDRTESIAYTYKRHSAEMHVKMGFKKNGVITAFSGDAIINTGAYIGYGLSVLGLLSEHFAGPYKIENVGVHSRLAYTNRTPASAFRGFGAPQAAFATESMISEAAELLGLDQIEIRKTNALSQGDVGALGQKIDHVCGMKEALTLLQNSALWKSKAQNKDKTVGYGVAAGHLSCGFGKGIPDNAEIDFEAKDGKFTFYIGLTEIGQGGVQSLTAIAADALGVDISKVKIVMGDTANTYDCGSTAASRSTFLGGNAIRAAAKEYLAKSPDKSLDAKLHVVVPFPENDMMKAIGMPHSMYTFVAQAVKVKVNPTTGEIKVLDMAAATEAGAVINPMQLNGQIQGGMMQSVGLALFENLKYDVSGKMITDSFTTYSLPTALDASNVSSEFVEAYEPSGPFGVKGAAESPTVPTAAAINGAVFDATGKWHYSLPITAESVLTEVK